MPLTIMQADITKLAVEAVVSSDDGQLSHGGGVSRAIAKSAGEKELASYLDAVSYLSPGTALLTPGLNLPAEKIIHVSTARKIDGKEKLHASYQAIFAIVIKNKIQSVALPLLSSGAFGFTREVSMAIALEEIQQFLDDYPEVDVRLVLYDRDARRLGQERFMEITTLLAEDFVEEELTTNLLSIYQEPVYSTDEEDTLDELLENTEKPFTLRLFDLIDQRGLKDAQVYKAANIDRKHFSKIRSNPLYHPKKSTILALAIALKCSLDETNQLLESAGYTLSPSSKSDIIVGYFINRQEFDIFVINETLFEFDCPQLV